jgi:MFS family permease
VSGCGWPARLLATGFVAGTLGGILRNKRALGLSDSEVGLSATHYLLGAVISALIFGDATDRLGRKKLFTWTLLLYLVATAATAFSWNFSSYALFRAFTGAGIGGEYAAMGAVGSIILLNGSWVQPTSGWRYVFGIGAVLGTGVLSSGATCRRALGGS